MAINAQFPSWITEGRIAEAQLGQQMGRNILEGLRFQEQKRQEERRIPLLNAQTELAKANLAGQLLQNEQNVIQANRANEARAAMASALAIDSEITRSGKWTDPANQAKFIEFLEKNPALAYEPWADSMRSRFAKAEQMAFEKEKFQTLAQNRLDVAQLKGQDKYGAQPYWEDANKLIESGVDPKEAFAKVAESATGAYSGRVKIAGDAMSSTLEGLEVAGIPLDDNLKKQLPSVWARFMLGGQNITGNTKLLGELSEEDTNWQRLQDVTEKISNFDSKYKQPGLFSDYIGPLDAPRFQAKKYMIDPKFLSEAEREAQDIFAEVDSIVQNYRKNNFGTALTASETSQFVKILSTPNYANYVQSLNAFKNAIGNKIRLNVQKNMFSPSLDIGVKQRWYQSPQPVQSGSPVGQPGGRQVQGGIIGQPQPVGQPLGQPTQEQVFDFVPGRGFIPSR